MAESRDVQTGELTELLDQLVAAADEPGTRDAIALYEDAMRYYVPASTGAGGAARSTASSNSSTWTR